MITVAQLLEEHVSLDIECVDRLYLNGYVPRLQTPQGLTSFMTYHLGKPVPSPALLNRLTHSFCSAVESFIAENDIPLVRFPKRQRKDDVANVIRAQRKIRDGVVFVGVAQEKASAFKGRKVGPYEFDDSRADVFVKHLKGCWYLVAGCWKAMSAPFGASRRALEEGDPFNQKPVTSDQGRKDPPPRCVGSIAWPSAELCLIWQLEFSRTQVFNRPGRGRQFFESVIRENLDLGRPERVQLVFDRQVRKTTPGRFSTRVVMCRQNLFCRHVAGYWLLVSSHANRCRLHQSKRVCGACRMKKATPPAARNETPETRSQALFAALVLFLHLPNGFRNRDLRTHVADLLGDETAGYTAGKMTYDLRRLRRKGIIARVPGTTRYFLTNYGYRVALFTTRVHARIIRPGFDCIGKAPEVAVPHPLRRALNHVGVAT